LAEGIVNQALIVAASGFVNLIAEPADHVFVQADRNPGLSLRNRDRGSTLRS
jgi:hypothetical protein